MSLKKSTFKAPLRYLIVVTGGFIVDFVLFAFLVEGGVSVYLAHLAGFCIGAAFNVLMIRRFVFTGSRFKIGTDIIFTILANGAMLFVGMAILWFFVEVLLINSYLAKLLANGITFLGNYVTRSIFFTIK